MQLDASHLTAITQAMLAKAQDIPTLIPATVLAYDNATGETTITIDGDNGEGSSASNLTGQALVTDQRVQVGFFPPHGVYVLGIISPQPWVHAEASAGTSVPSATITVVNFDTVLWDYTSNYNSTTGVFTAPIAGIYDVRWTVGFGTLVANTSLVNSAMYVNGALKKYGYRINLNGQTGSWLFSGSTHVLLAASDTIDIRVQQNDAGAVARNTSVGVASDFIVKFIA